MTSSCSTSTTTATTGPAWCFPPDRVVGLVARLIQSMGQFDANSVLEDTQWPMAGPYRRLAAGSMPDVTTAREARGATEP